jgi:hypothetical protein
MLAWEVTGGVRRAGQDSPPAKPITLPPVRAPFLPFPTGNVPGFRPEDDKPRRLPDVVASDRPGETPPNPRGNRQSGSSSGHTDRRTSRPRRYAPRITRAVW